MEYQIISTYTSDQAIEDGFLTILGPSNWLMTVGVYNLKGIGFDSKDDDYMFEAELKQAIMDEYNQMPTRSTDGGNDKDFFSITWRGTKFFVARNEKDGLTVMLPGEY